VAEGKQPYGCCKVRSVGSWSYLRSWTWER